MVKPVWMLQAGDEVGSEGRLLYTVASDAVPGPGGTVSVDVVPADDDLVVPRTWLYGHEAQVHVRESRVEA